MSGGGDKKEQTRSYSSTSLILRNRNEGVALSKVLVQFSLEQKYSQKIWDVNKRLLEKRYEHLLPASSWQQAENADPCFRYIREPSKKVRVRHQRSLSPRKHVAQPPQLSITRAKTDLPISRALKPSNLKNSLPVPRNTHRLGSAPASQSLASPTSSTKSFWESSGPSSHRNSIRPASRAT